MILSVTYSGALAPNNQASIRTLAKTFTSLQRAIDRSFIDSSTGELWKYARMKSEDYNHCDIYFVRSEEGSFWAIIDSTSANIQEALSRLRVSMHDIHARSIAGFIETASQLKEDYRTRKLSLANPDIRIRDYVDVADDPHIRTSYAVRSISKEIDQMIAPLRSDQLNGEAGIALTLYLDSGLYAFEFNRETSERFHKIVSKKVLGEHIGYVGRVYEMNSKTLRAKIDHAYEGVSSSSVIYFENKEDYSEFNATVKTDDVGAFVGCPVIECGGFDPFGGDVYYISGVEKIDEE
jgi:ribosomal protein S17E